jgi:hypothetical protein
MSKVGEAQACAPWLGAELMDIPITDTHMARASHGIAVGRAVTAFKLLPYATLAAARVALVLPLVLTFVGASASQYRRDRGGSGCGAMGRLEQ